MDLLDIFSDADDVQNVPAGEVILSEGQAGDCMYVVLEGELLISLNDKELDRAGPGQIIGEMALINSDKRSASISTLTDCKLVKIDQKSFSSLLKHVPEFSLHVMTVLTNRLQRTYDMLED